MSKCIVDEVDSQAASNIIQNPAESSLLLTSSEASGRLQGPKSYIREIPGTGIAPEDMDLYVIGKPYLFFKFVVGQCILES